MSYRQNKSTSRDWQRSLFIGSLAEQLDKMATISGELEAEMQTYLNEGLSPSEAEELLMADGHDSDIVRSCSSRFSSSTPKTLSENIERWGYRIGDNYGRIVSHVEMEAVIEASSIEDATSQLKQMIEDSGSDAGFKDIIEVFPLDKGAP
jgi:hypothetical protein